MIMPFYGVTARVNGREVEVYDGTDGSEAEALAIRAHIRYHGRAYVSVLLDGGTWHDVKHVPGDLRTAQLCEPFCCLHPQCGQINPLSCYCVEYMDAETRERYRNEYA
jgi:hypothetical protein